MRFVIALALMVELAWPAAARAQETGSSDPDVTQALSAALGLEMGIGGATPGGVRLAGMHLYRLAERDWLASQIAVTYGNPGIDCVEDQTGALDCDHGLLDGVAITLGSGIRRTFASQGAFLPYAQVGLALKLVSFPSDDVAGAGAVITAGGGIRAEVADGVAVFGGAVLQGGVAVLSRELGAEPQFSFTVHGGAELSL